MELLTLIGLIVVVYFAVYILLLPMIDCDLGLWYADNFGRRLDELKGKVVWITGASSGIGEFLAVEMAKHGAKLVLTARSVLNLERVKGRCLGERKEKDINRFAHGFVEAGCTIEDILLLPTDITETEKHEEMFARVITHFGKLNILVNNAGRSQRAVWENIEPGVDRELFDLNVFSIVSLTRLAVKYFLKVGKGHIVATSSLAGVIGAPFSASYTASKHALHGYYKSLRTEKLGKHISVTLICPGPVFSNFLPHCFTGKHGEEFGQDVAPSDRRMTTARCAYLSAVAIVNKLDEAWVGVFPVVPITYLLVFFPTLSKWIAQFVGTKEIMKLRDSRVVIDANGKGE